MEAAAPKRNSARDLTMTETIYQAVVAYISLRSRKAAAAGEKWADSGFLFVDPIGVPLHSTTVRAASLKICDDAPFIIQKVLGHSQLSTTLTYTHVPKSVTKAALTGLESLIAASGTRAASRSDTVKTTVKRAEMD